MPSFLSEGPGPATRLPHLQNSSENGPTSTSLREQLKTLIDDKQKQLVLVGTLGQRFLSQQVELEERIQQMDEVENASELGELGNGTDLRQKIEELAQTMQQWEAENQQMWTTALTLGSRMTNGDELAGNNILGEGEASFSASFGEDVSLPTEAGPSAVQSSRRARNVGLPRTNNVGELDWYEDIGNHLTREIRRMHALLSERDKALQDMKEERDDLEKSLESLRSALREREASAEKFKDENWNLEFQLQEVRGKLADAEAATQRAEADHKRTVRQLTTARETVDAHKNESERLKVALEDLKVKHETDVAQMRRQTATLQREKSDLQTVLDEVKSDLAKKSRSVPNRFNSPITPTEAYGTPGENDVFTEGNSTRRKFDTSAMLTPSEVFDTSPDASPSRPSVVVTPSHPSNEVEALKQSLAHAHRQMSTLKNSINREKELKMEYRRKLNQEGIAVDWEDEDNVMEGSPHHPRSRGGTPSRGGKSGRGRGTGKLSLAHLLGMAAAERALEGPDSPYRQQDDDDAGSISQDAGLEHEEPSPFIDAKSSRPTSFDGMDPAFANVLRAVPSDDTINTSPIPPRSRTLPRRQRGGGAFKDQRPVSLVDTAPTALSAELRQDDGQSNDIINEVMLGDEDQFEDPLLTYGPYVETTEIGIQSEPEPIASIPHAIQTAEVAVQSDPEPEGRKVDASSQADLVVPPASLSSLNVSMGTLIAPAQAIKSVETMEVSIQWEPVLLQTSSMSSQTDEIAVPSMSEVSISTEPEPEHFNSGVSTDPPHVVSAHTQTTAIAFAHVLTQTTSSTTSEAQVQVDPSPSALTSMPVPLIIEPQTSLQQIPITISTSSDVVMPRPSSRGRSPVQRPVAMLFESDSEETETEAEYVDARENEPTPSSSVQDFQSFQTATPDDDESDSESVRTSTGVGAVYRTSPMGSRILRIRHDSQATTRVAAPPKPELKEMSVQTDDISPPPKSPVAGVNAINFHRVGSTQSTQFQFIPSSPIKATSSTLTVSANVSKPPIRDSVGTFGITGRIRTPSITSGDRRPSTDSFASRAEEVPPSPALSIASPVAPVDKTRPPTMSLPPPPSMPPPSTLPVKKGSAPPPRPTSPPPPELVQRATTPTFGRQNSLMVPPSRVNRPSGGSMPPPQTALRKPQSTSSFRSAVNAASRAGPRSGPLPSTLINGAADRRDMSQTSLLSGSSVPSRQHSVSSSRSSERRAAQSVPQTPPNVSGGSTDPAVIHAITQTMIGEFLYKYTRRVVGKGHGEKRHKRFFWVHPYTKTLYWSSADPGASNAGESNAKSAYIDAVKSVLDPNPMPPGLHQYSIVVYTPQREMKFTAPTKERHDIWFRALSYLLDRPSTVPVTSPAGGSMPASPMPSRQRPGTPGEDGMRRVTPAMMASPSSVRSAVSNGSVDSWNLTPRARAQTHLSPPSVGRRAGTPAAEYLRTYSDAQYRPFPDAQSPTKSIRSLQQRFEDALDDRDEEDFENVDNHLPHLNSGEFEINTDGSEGFEGLENVRACCDGEHDLNHLAKGPGHHHHHHHHVNQAAIRPSSRISSHPDPISPSSRPVSPSAWSFRSRSGSQPSDGASLFSWGGGGDGSGKRSIRFGSKRSTKSSTPVPT